MRALAGDADDTHVVLDAVSRRPGPGALLRFDIGSPPRIDTFEMNPLFEPAYSNRAMLIYRLNDGSRPLGTADPDAEARDHR